MPPLKPVFSGVFDPVKERMAPAACKGQALVVFAHNRGLALVYQADETLQTFVQEAGGSADAFDLEIVGADFDHTPDGLYIFEMKLIDDGPGDYPGSRESCIQLNNPRPATAKEWEAHCNDEWPWDPSQYVVREQTP